MPQIKTAPDTRPQGKYLHPEGVRLGGENYPEISVEPPGESSLPGPGCFVLRYDYFDDRHDLIHVCDWPAMKATIDKFLGDRNA